MVFLIPFIAFFAKIYIAIRLVAFEAKEGYKFNPVYALIACAMVGCALASAFSILISGKTVNVFEMVVAVIIAICIKFANGNIATLFSTIKSLFYSQRGWKHGK